MEQLIVQWKALHRNPKIIHLDTYGEYNAVKYEHDFIEFPVGGKVGDIMWKTQYAHNLSVSAKQYNEPLVFR